MELDKTEEKQTALDAFAAEGGTWSPVKDSPAMSLRLTSFKLGQNQDSNSSLFQDFHVSLLQ